MGDIINYYVFHFFAHSSNFKNRFYDNYDELNALNNCATLLNSDAELHFSFKNGFYIYLFDVL